MQAQKRRGRTHRRKPWYVQYREPDGTQKSPGFPTKAAADAWIREHAAQIHARKQLVPLVPSDSTVAVYGPRWLAMVVATVKPRTHESYASQFARYVLPALGTRPVGDLTRPELRTFLIECRQRGVAGHALRPGSIYAIYATIRALLNAAIEDGLRADNPAARLGKVLHLHPSKLARQATIRRRALDREQTAQLLEHTRTTEPGWYPLVLTLPRTGLRLGEALTLRLDDYNGGARTLRIERAWNAKHKREEEPKHGARTVDVSAELAAVLDPHAAAIRKVVGLDGTPVVAWLFPSEARTMLDGRNVRRALARLSEGAQLGRTLNPHDLRHTFGSQLIAAGKSPVYVQRQMGHASVQTTVDLYGTGLPLEDRRGVDALDAGGATSTAGGGKDGGRNGFRARRRREA
jgi:integrase